MKRLLFRAAMMLLIMVVTTTTAAAASMPVAAKPASGTKSRLVTNQW